MTHSEALRFLITDLDISLTAAVRSQTSPPLGSQANLPLPPSLS